MADVSIGRGIKALKVNTGADMDPIATTSRSVLEQGTTEGDCGPQIAAAGDRLMNLQGIEDGLGCEAEVEATRFVDLDIEILLPHSAI